MSLLPNQTNVNQDRYFFLLVDSKVINTSTINANVGFISTINSQNINSSTINANVGFISTLYSQNLNSSTINNNYANISSLYVSSINGIFFGSSTISTSFLNISSAYINTLFTSSIYNSFLISTSILNANKAFISTLITDSINVSSINSKNIVCSTLKVKDTAELYGDTSLNGFYTTNNMLVQYSNVPVFGKMFLYDMSNLRILEAEQLNIKGGAKTTPPFLNNTFVNIGEDINHPAIVNISGVNPNPIDPLLNLTTALTTTGSVIFNGGGSFTSFSGGNFYALEGTPTALSVLGNIEITGTGEIIGAFVCLGTLNVLGILTSSGGQVFSGGTLINGTLTQEFGTITFYGEQNNFGNTILNSNLTVYGNTNLQNVSTTTITAESINLYNSTNNAVLNIYDSSNSILGVFGKDSNNDNTLIIGSFKNTLVASAETLSFVALSTIFQFGALDLSNNILGNLTNLYFSDCNRTYSGSQVFDIVNYKDPSIVFDVPLIVNNPLGNIQIYNNTQPKISFNNLLTLKQGNILYDNDIGFILDDSLNVSNIATSNIFTSNIYTYNLGQPDPINYHPINIETDLNLQDNSLYNITNITTNGVSSINVSTNSLSVNKITTNVYTNDVYPDSVYSQLGYFGATGSLSGGFYNRLQVKSTITQSISPDIVGSFSNKIYINGNISTQNILISSINNQLLTYASSINMPPSTFSINGANAITPIILYSNIQFPHSGQFNLYQKVVLSKTTGGSSADDHAQILYINGRFISTFTRTETCATIPSLNNNNLSCFTTLATTIFISTNNLTRNICYNDLKGANYTANLFFDKIEYTYIPNIF